MFIESLKVPIIHSEHRILMISQDTKKPMIINFALFDPELPQCDIQQLAPPHH